MLMDEDKIKDSLTVLGCYLGAMLCRQKIIFPRFGFGAAFDTIFSDQS